MILQEVFVPQHFSPRREPVPLSSRPGLKTLISSCALIMSEIQEPTGREWTTHRLLYRFPNLFAKSPQDHEQRVEHVSSYTAQLLQLPGMQCETSLRRWQSNNDTHWSL